ncbi:hypothetical protein LTS15_005215 [Exophiala xenobiotica]|nr:hypothetical protein LTS15_005215 [Exophiala xenobiotica]
MTSPEHVCLPINLDAFILNENVCNSGESRIAPIVQPNYVSLRLQNSAIQHDILPRIDLHNSRPAIVNPRIAKTYSDTFHKLNLDHPQEEAVSLGSIDRSRCGIYLHWTVPRGYRSGYSQAANPPPTNASTDGQGRKSTSKYSEPSPNPEFPRVPNRWLLVRVLRNFSVETPTTVKPDLVTAWVIESDKLWKVEQLDSSIDLATDVTPFVAYAGDETNNGDILNNQAENYIGLKIPLDQWSELTKPGGKEPDLDRVPLTVMNSSNPVFADYAIHNPNVFSTKDNLKFGEDADGNPLYLKTATCDYIIVGWHSDPQFDPLGNSTGTDLRSRMTSFQCQAPANSDGKDDKTTKDTKTVTDNGSSDKTRLFCHAARYSVVFDESKPETPADHYAKNFTKDVDMEPVAVGTSPLDAVLAFVDAHLTDEDFENTVFGTGDDDGVTAVVGGRQQSDKTKAAAPMDKSTTVKTANTLHNLRELLYATEDDYDSRIKAADLVFAHNFGRVPGGFWWHYDKRKSDNEPPQEPSPEETLALERLNEYQRLWDTADRQLSLLRWALFAEFFKYVSDPSAGQPNEQDMARTKGLYNGRVENLRFEIKTLMASQQVLEASIDGIAIQNGNVTGSSTVGPKAPAQQAKGTQRAVEQGVKTQVQDTKVLVRKIAYDPFYKRTDPSICLAGLDSGWDPEFLDGSTPSRFFHQVKDPVDAKLSGVADTVLSTIGNTLPDAFDKTVSKLVREASGGFDEGLTLLGHKQWNNKQPFSPQFVEWEGMYYHVDDNEWDIQLATSALSSSNHTQVAYINPHQLSSLPAATNPRNDTRHISGRMLVLPQPSFALDAVVAQVLGSTPKADLPDELKTEDQRKQFRADIKKLKFVSGQLSGLTDALVTCAVGQHVKPNVQPQTGERRPRPMKAAIDAASPIGMVEKDFELIGSETGRTPYGTLTDFRNVAGQSSQSQEDRFYKPFKPVQQGQFAITSINIVDKFGQTISCPLPQETPGQRTRKPKPGELPATPSFIHPCLSQQLLPSLLDNTLNTVYTPTETEDKNTNTDYPMTPFMQLTPAINQEARINATFVNKLGNGSKKPWKPCNDWEVPIFGWIIVNYADSSLQFFTGDGTFYTALMYGGPTGTIETNRFLPFEQPATANDASPQRKQLDDLIAKLTSVNSQSKEYFHALWDLIVKATPTMPFPPSDYAKYANSIVGKPLALVNVGWSLELAQPPLWAQHMLPEPPYVAFGEKDPVRLHAFDYLTKRPFKVKIGDADRPFDGVCAYWEAEAEDPYKDIYTYFLDRKNPDSIRKDIVPESYPHLNPYYLDPQDFMAKSTFDAAHIQQLLVKTLLIDPYTPLHLYSGILPTRSLQLPAWTMQKAMKNMTAFFTMGPLLITKDVPKLWDEGHKLMPDTWITMQEEQKATETVPPIKLPIAGTKGMWNWLQPYSVPKHQVTPAAPTPPQAPPPTPPQTPSPSSNTNPPPNPTNPASIHFLDPNDPTNETHYNAFEVGTEDGKIRMDPAPYTFVEGFLQLAGSLLHASVEPAAPVVPKAGTK